MTSSIVSAQSKKELQAEVNQLKVTIEEMKKPKETLLDSEHKKVSYGLGVLMASNLKTQGGDSLDLESLTSGMKDALLGRPLKVSEQEAMAMVQPYMMKAMERKTAKMKEEGVILNYEVNKVFDPKGKKMVDMMLNIQPSFVFERETKKANHLETRNQRLIESELPD